MFLLAFAFMVGGIFGLVLGTYTTLREVKRRRDQHLAWLWEREKATR